MTSLAFRLAVGPCHGGCGKNIKYSRKPGALGLCSACLATPSIKDAAVANRAMFRKEMDNLIADHGTWDPRVGAYRMDPAAFGLAPKRRKTHP